MSSIIAYFTIFIIFGIYYFYKKRVNRRFGESPINKKIEIIYKKWYRINEYLLNKSTTKVPEINKLLYNLKERLEEEGIFQEHLEAYIKIIENNSSAPRLGIKDAIIAVLGFFTTNSLIKTQIEKFDINKLPEQILKISKDEKMLQFVQNFYYILLNIIIIFSMGIFIYMIITFDTIHKDNQRLFVLKELDKIWSYDVDNTEISDDIRLLPNKIYTKIKWSQSNFDKVLNITIGEGVKKNLNITEDIVSETSNRFFKTLKKFCFFILGFAFPVLSEIAFVAFLHGIVIYYKSSRSVDPLFWGVLIILIMFELAIYSLLAILINSQIDIYAKESNPDNIEEFLGKEYFSKKLTIQNWCQIVFHSLIIIILLYFIPTTLVIKVVSGIIFFLTGYVVVRYSFKE